MFARGALPRCQSADSRAFLGWGRSYGFFSSPVCDGGFDDAKLSSSARLLACRLECTLDIAHWRSALLGDLETEPGALQP